MSYQNQYGPPGRLPVVSKSGILTVTLLTTIAAAVGLAAFFVVTYIEDPTASYTYYEFINEAENLKTDAMIIGGGLILSVICAWLIYAAPRGVLATILRIIFVLAGIATAGIAILSIFVAGVEDGPSFMDIVNANENTNWGVGAWTILATSCLVFVLSIVMIFVVMQHRRAAQRHESYAVMMDRRSQYGAPQHYGQHAPNQYPPQQNTDPHSWGGR